MEELIKWLEANHISYKEIDKEVVEIEAFGKVFLADLSSVNSIFRGTKDNLTFKTMESPEILMQEGIFYIAFPFGKNWYYYDLREPFKFNILKYVGKRKDTKKNTPFVNLGIHTGYELLNGSGDLSLWVKKAKLMGHGAVGICDYNTMAATLVLQKECKKGGIKHVFGYSFTLAHGESKVDMKIYCQSQQGLRNLLRIQKEIMVDSQDNTMSLDGLVKYAAGNVLVLGKLSSHWMHGNMHIINLLKDAFDGIYYQVDLSEYKAERIDLEVLQATRFYFTNFHKAGKYIVEPVLICDNYYLDKDDARSKIVLNKIARGAAHKQSDDQYFKDADEHYETIAKLFNADMWDVDSLFGLMCGNTVKIADNATACYELGKMFMPEYIMLDEEKQKYGNRRKMFRDLLAEELKAKIRDSDRNIYVKRLEEEVYIIESTNNVDYFLIQYDMIREARRRNITTGIGRGSAGGSLVSYLLGIITIDPIKYDLLFSRFLVPERCGLNWLDEITVMADDVAVKAGDSAVEVNINGTKLLFFKDAEFRVKREGKTITVYADELCEGDDILFDNRDLLWTLKDMLA